MKSRETSWKLAQFLTIDQAKYFRKNKQHKKPIPDLEEIMTLSPALRNSLASAKPIPEKYSKQKNK